MDTREFYAYRYNNKDSTPFYVSKGSKNRINESHLLWSSARRKAQMKNKLITETSNGWMA